MKLILSAAIFILGSAPQQALRPADIDALKTLIKPRAEETRWEEIPWMVDLWDARKKAAQEGKPIMLWEMDGNPMGCG
jgi:hypothetical protein